MGPLWFLLFNTIGQCSSTLGLYPHWGWKHRALKFLSVFLFQVLDRNNVVSMAWMKFSFFFACAQRHFAALFPTPDAQPYEPVLIV